MVDRRMTKQRQIILEELRNVFSHPSAQEIYELISTSYPGIGLATIYRNLEILETEGEIIKIITKSGKARYDGHVHKHLHLICKKCGEIFDIEDVSSVKICSQTIEKSGFEMDLDNLKISGICKNCIS